MKIIKVDFLTLYFLLILLLCGYIKIGIIVFFIVIIHEFGHVFFAKILKYKIKKITIYPFGGITKLEKDINTPLKHELLIACGGIFFQIIIGIIALMIPISLYTKNIIIKYNTSIFLFNILPIIPLDGSIILNCILNKFLSYKKSYIIYIIVSIVMIIFYILGNYWFSLNNYLMVTLFVYKIYEAIKNYKYIYNRFLLERYLNNYKFKYISTKKGNLDILKIDTYQYFKNNHSIISEKEKLRKKFDKF